MRIRASGSAATAGAGAQSAPAPRNAAISQRWLRSAGRVAATRVTPAVVVGRRGRHEGVVAPARSVVATGPVAVAGVVAAAGAVVAAGPVAVAGVVAAAGAVVAAGAVAVTRVVSPTRPVVAARGVAVAGVVATAGAVVPAGRVSISVVVVVDGDEISAAVVLAQVDRVDGLCLALVERPDIAGAEPTEGDDDGERDDCHTCGHVCSPPGSIATPSSERPVSGL